MSINDSKEKINPVRDRGSLRALAISNGVKRIIESEQGKDVFVILIVVLAILSSFGLGRLSKSAENSGLKIAYPSPVPVQPIGQEASANSSLQSANFDNNSIKVLSVPNSVGKSFFASKRGHKYYSIGCSAGKTIKQENRVYFSTGAEAEKAGYELSSSCK